jgi:membrane fusion protein (multidrug efflux system)
LKKKLLITALCLAAGVLVICLLRPKHAAAEKPVPATEAGTQKRSRDGTPVRTLVIKPQTFDETIVATGTVRADESIDVQPEIAGKLLHIYFEEGSRVRTGDLLAVINDAELRASLQRAVYRRELAELKTRRIAALIDKGGVPQQEYDIAASELSVLGAEVELIQAQLARTQIRAPFDGTIGLRSVSEGSQISPATRLTTLQNVARMKVDFTVPEKHAAVLAPGSHVTFSVAGSSRTYTAEVYAVDPHLDEITRTRLVRARTPNPDQSLLPGAFARVTVPLARLEGALMIPTTALAAEAGEKAVFVVEKGKARRQVVQTGPRRAESVLITAGLRQGDEVIVTGLQMVRPGAAVDSTPIN